jgi:hypothetical protein
VFTVQSIGTLSPKLVLQNSIEGMVVSIFLSLALGLPAIVSGQQLVSFDDAKASSNFAPSFGARAVTKESSGYWCSAGSHSAAQVVSWTGLMGTLRSLTGINVHWSYAPAEVKVLGSVDGGNFEELLPWRKNTRSEPSFEESFQFTKPVNARSITILMRGPKTWGYFGISSVTAVSNAFHFMLVSGLSGSQEVCVTTSSASLVASPCLESIVEGSGKEIFAFTEANELQTVGGKCLTLFGSSLSVSDCGLASPTRWEATSDGQVKHGKNCLAVLPSLKVVVRDCDEVAGSDEGKLFQVAVPEYKPSESVSARSIAQLLKNAVSRQKKLLAKLEKASSRCKGASFVEFDHLIASNIVLVKSNGTATQSVSKKDLSIVNSIPAGLGLDISELSQVLATSKAVLSSSK